MRRRGRAAPSADARRARGRAARRGEGDRPAQPPRLVELPLLPGVRPGVEVPAVRRLARAPPRRRQRHLPPLRPSRAACPGSCPDCGSTSVARHGLGHRAARARARRADERRCPSSGWTPTWPGSERGAAAIRRRACRRAGRHADGCEGPRLPRRHARRRRGRRLHASLPRLPRRGADVRARRPARRPQRPRVARRTGDRADGGPVGATACATPPRTTPRRSWTSELARRRLLSYPPFATLIRVVCSSEEAGRELAAAEAIRDRIDGVPVLGPAPLFRVKGRERAQLVVKATDRSAAVRAVRQAVEAEHGRSGVNFAVDVDPQ